MTPKLLLSLSLACGCALAQGAAAPPAVIRIVSGPGRPGTPRAYAQVQAKVEVVGLMAMTGAAQTWWIELHPTFASIEDLENALSAAGWSGVNGDYRSIIAVLQPGLSYRPEEAVRSLPKARYMRVTIHRIGAGLEAQFGASANTRKAVSESINSDRPDLFYHVVSGDDSGTYIVLSPLESLRVLDEAGAETPTYAAQAADALARNAAVEISRQHILFTVEPRISYVSDGFASGDSGFWHP